MTDLEIAVAAARAGAAIVADGFGRAVDAEYKGRFDPVTKIDRASEQAIVDIIRAGRGDDAIVAEEGGGIESEGRHWFIDPLDGTVNFIKNIPHLSVSIALWDGATPLIGVVLDPFRDECFTAAAGAGADRRRGVRRQRRDGERVRRLRGTSRAAGRRRGGGRRDGGVPGQGWGHHVWLLE